MKIFITSTTILLLTITSIMAQETMYIYQKNGQITQIEVNNIDSITFSDLTDTIHIETVTDIDLNIYRTVTIGNQVWMAENLKTSHYADGTSIPLVTGTGNWSLLSYTNRAYCWYNDDLINKDIYGALYNWAAATNGAASSETNPSSIQGVCPSGWHLPCDAEWNGLIDFLGGGSEAGGKLKETGTIHWVNPNTAATNETFFTALPGGSRDYNGKFSYVGEYGLWWSSSEENNSMAWARYIGYNSGSADRGDGDKLDGFSVRCVKD